MKRLLVVILAITFAGGCAGLRMGGTDDSAAARAE